jgi:wobble nucleotide-excising tRNase
MSSKKGLGETVLGWFVVREDEGEEPEATTEELIEKYEKKSAAAAPAPAAARPHAPAAAPVAPPPPAVKLNAAVPKIIAGSTPTAAVFAQVYRSAEIDDEEQERVEKAMTLLTSLPNETPKDIKKQIVEASMKAFGIPVDQIIETGAQEIQALDAFIKHGEAQTQSVLSDARARVIKLDAEIAEIKKLMELQVGTQESLARATNEQKLRVQSVLEFFGQEAVARVVRESPKLVELK